MRSHLELDGMSVKWDENLHRDGNSFADFTYIDVRHRILQNIKRKLKITKLKRILNVVIPGTYNYSKHDEQKF